jgi:hypothetical protein
MEDVSLPHLSSQEPLNPNVRCVTRTCRWRFRELHLVSVPGFSATEKKCPQCGTRQLLVFHTGKIGTFHQSSIPLIGKPTETQIRTALGGVGGITEHDIEFIITAAIQLAGHAETP